MRESRQGRGWTEDELVDVLSLSCQLPFGQMHGRNPVVIKFAASLKRTPSSVALKLVNFASFDPALQSRGVRGMSNASRLDREVWDKYFGRWPRLASLDAAEEAASTRWLGRHTSVERVVIARLGQGFFRNAVLSAYEGACCITGICAAGLLRASHIVPWSASEQQRLNPANGLCLNALHDAAFDQGLLGIDEQLKVLISRTTRELMPAAVFDDYFRRYEGQRIREPERFRPDVQWLRYHLDHVFIS